MPGPATSHGDSAGMPIAASGWLTCAVAGPNGLSVPTSSCTNTSVTFTIPAAGWDGDYVVSVTVTDHNGGSLTASDVYTFTCGVLGPSVSVALSSCTAAGVSFTIPAGGWDGDYVVSVTVTDHNGGSLTASDIYTLTQVTPTVTAPAPSTSRTVTVAVVPGADVNTIACGVVGPNGSVALPSCTAGGGDFTMPAAGRGGE